MEATGLLQENQQENNEAEKKTKSCDNELPKCDFDSSNDCEWEDDVEKVTPGESLVESSENNFVDQRGAVGGISEEEILDPDISHETSDVSGIDRLLQRHKNEIMFELRKLKFGDRPVTGGDDRRHAVEALVGRCVGRSPSQVDRTPYEARITHTESRRPEQVLVEVNALVERRPVSSVLQSVAFRRSLETSLRGAIGALQRNTSRGATVQSRVEQFQHSATADSTASIADENVAPVNHVSHSSGASMTSSETTEMSRSATATQQVSSFTQSRSTPTSNSPIPPADQPYVAGPARAQEWLQHHVPAVVDLGDQQQMTNFELLQEMHRENLIMDISELIQSHLVTSALEGDFRHVLERRMRNHLDQSGVDGRRVQQHIQQLPRSHVHRRNDFYDLGIVGAAEGGAAGGMVDHMDDVSVISATAAVAVPHAYTQSTTAMSREVRSLRTEVRELRGLMQLSFDLQLDIQRAVRQEVAAALAQSLGGTDNPRPAAPSATGPPRPAQTTGSDCQCLICLDKSVDTVLYQCGHMCLCYGCGLQLKQRGAHCPVCRAPIRDIIKAYQSL